jgi:IclR family transcriptional regulator, KDG regulon repressor
MTPNKQTDKKTYFVQALDRALNILDCFSLEKKELGLSQIVVATGLHRTTATRILNHLAARNILQFDPETKRYQLGSKVLELGGIAISSISLRKVSRPHLSRLRDETGLTLLLAINLEDHYVFVDKHEGRGILKLAADIGWRRPLNFGLFGMIFLAYLSPEKQNTLLNSFSLKRYTPKSIVDLKTFRQYLKNILRDGYFVEKELFHEDICGVAAPIRDYSKNVVACIGTAANLKRMKDPAGTKELGKKLMDTANAISADLGFNGP